MDILNETDIVKRALAKHVGTYGLACGCLKCKSKKAYVNEMGGISCSVCKPPVVPEYNRLDLIMVPAGGRGMWLDAREETLVAKWSAQCGVDKQVLRDYLKMMRSLPPEYTEGFVQESPPPYIAG